MFEGKGPKYRINNVWHLPNLSVENSYKYYRFYFCAKNAVIHHNLQWLTDLTSWKAIQHMSTAYVTL